MTSDANDTERSTKGEVSENGTDTQSDTEKRDSAEESVEDKSNIPDGGGNEPPPSVASGLADMIDNMDDADSSDDTEAESKENIEQSKEDANASAHVGTRTESYVMIHA